MNKSTDLYSISYPEAKAIVACGDIHGDFNHLVFKLCVQYQMKDTVLIVAGDCGLGFEKKESYENMVRRNSRRMNEANNWIVLVRGNHDNPAYFDGKSFKHKRFIAVPDYSIINACSHIVLCVGGAVSIDRQYRIAEINKIRNHSIASKSEDSPFSRDIYWPNEKPCFDEMKLKFIKEQYRINTVITHTAPSFCELFTKGGLASWAEGDTALLEDVEEERSIMKNLHSNLIADRHPITHWCYGHFHQSWHSSINGIMFTMLDILEFYPLY